MQVAALGFPQQGAQVIGEQMVEPIPAALEVEGHEEEVHPLGESKQRRRVVAPGECLAELG